MLNYKTTIIGLVGAIYVAIWPLISNGTFDWSKDWKNIVGAAIIASLGYFAKDYNVSGSNPPKNVDNTNKMQ